MNKNLFIGEILKKTQSLLNIVDKEGRTALFYCCLNNDLESVKLLESEAGKCDNNGICALKIGINNKNAKICKELIKTELKYIDDYDKQYLAENGIIDKDE